MKNANEITRLMGKGAWFEGVILHELAHGYHINFLGYNYKPIHKAW